MPKASRNSRKRNAGSTELVNSRTFLCTRPSLSIASTASILSCLSHDTSALPSQITHDFASWHLHASSYLSIRCPCCLADQQFAHNETHAHSNACQSPDDMLWPAILDAHLAHAKLKWSMWPDVLGSLSSGCPSGLEEPSLPDAVRSRDSGLERASCMRASTSGLVVALIKMRWQLLGSCAITFPPSDAG